MSARKSALLQIAALWALVGLFLVLLIAAGPIGGAIAAAAAVVAGICFGRIEVEPVEVPEPRSMLSGPVTTFEPLRERAFGWALAAGWLVLTAMVIGTKDIFGLETYVAAHVIVVLFLLTNAATNWWVHG